MPRSILSRIWQSLPGTATAFSRMHARARHQRPWRNATPHQQAHIFTQHNQMLNHLKSQHAARKIAPHIIDGIYGFITRKDVLEFIFTILILLWICNSR